MSEEILTATMLVDASPDAVFAVLADPTTHAAIDGTGWVRGAVDGATLTEPGQQFRIAMYHRDHPNGDYEITNRVVELEAPRVISWRLPGYDAEGTGELDFGGWTWRYELAPAEGGRCEVTLTYDWSGADAQSREDVDFPPFPVSHLERSLAHLGELAGR